MRFDRGAEYEVVSGVSAGAINAHLLAQHHVGHELEAVEAMEKFWRDLAANDKDLYHSWNWGLLSGFIYQGALYDSTNAFDFIEEKFTGKELVRNANIGIADILNGQYKIFKDSRSPEDMVKILQASLVYPGVL